VLEATMQREAVVLQVTLEEYFSKLVCPTSNLFKMKVSRIRIFFSLPAC